MFKYILAAVFLIIFLFMGFFSFKSPVSSATEALKDAGYHPTEVGGYAWFACGNDDFYATKFKAFSPDSSRTVTGAVCQGFFKGKTIRLD